MAVLDLQLPRGVAELGQVTQLIVGEFHLWLLQETDGSVLGS